MKQILAISLFLYCGVVFAYKANPGIRNGNEAMEKGQYKEAEESYTDAIKKDRKSVESYYNLGNAQYKQEKYIEAIKNYESALSLTNDNQQKSAIYHNLGNACYKLEDYQGSVEAYKNALRLNPKDEDARYNLAMAQQKLSCSAGGGGGQDQQKEDQQDNQQQQQQQQQQDQQDEEQDQQQNPDQMTQEQAQRILDAYLEEEQEEQEKQKIPVQPRKKYEKDW